MDKFPLPVDFTVDVPRRMVFTAATGVIIAEDVLRHMDSISRHPDFRPEFNQILDLRQVTEFRLSSEDLRRFSQRNNFSPSSRRSFLVASDLLFGLARMFDTYRQLAGERGIKIMTEMNEACAWVGLPEEDH